MTFVKSPFYNINRIVLLLLGIWPYQENKFILYIQRLFSLGILISFIVCQLLLLLTEKYSMTLLFNILSQAFPAVIYLLKYNTFCINSKSVKLLLEGIQHNWTTLNEKELQIVKQYANISRLYMIIFTSVAILILCTFTFMQLLPVFLDVIIPLNISRARYFYFRFEFFVNEEKYFYLIAFYSILSLAVGAATLVSTGASLLTFGHHSCAMLKIACCRMEHAMDKYKGLHVIKRKEIENEIISAVDIHRKAVELVFMQTTRCSLFVSTLFVLTLFLHIFSLLYKPSSPKVGAFTHNKISIHIYADTLISPFMMSYLGLIIIGVISLSLNLFRLFQALLYSHNLEEILMSVFLIGAHFLYMFLANYGSQIITDHFDDIFIAAYDIPWYAAPIRIQKLVILLLQRGTKTFVLQIGGIFTGSLEGFATLLSTSLSYFTVIYATR